jgi:hypothetical protein
VTTNRTLEDIVSNLDEMSVTIEEIKDQGCASATTDKLDSLREEMTRTAELIEEALESGTGTVKD